MVSEVCNLVIHKRGVEDLAAGEGPGVIPSTMITAVVAASTVAV